jgi:hypothetical protein
MQELRDAACNILAIYEAPTASSSSNAMSIRIFVTLSRFIVLFIFFFLSAADFIYRRFPASGKRKEPSRLSRPTPLQSASPWRRSAGPGR